jgi:hypothetical protein
MLEIVISLVAAVACKVATRVGTSNQATNYFWLARNSPARSSDNYEAPSLWLFGTVVDARLNCTMPGLVQQRVKHQINTTSNATNSCLKALYTQLLLIF